MTYAEKLRHPRWQKRRLEIFQRDQWTCRCCGGKELNLQVHHLVYGKQDPWDYPDHCLLTLCENCHGERTEIMDRMLNAIRLQHALTPTRELSALAQKECALALSVIPVNKSSHES